MEYFPFKTSMLAKNDQKYIVKVFSRGFKLYYCYIYLFLLLLFSVFILIKTLLAYLTDLWLQLCFISIMIQYLRKKKLETKHKVRMTWEAINSLNGFPIR